MPLSGRGSGLVSCGLSQHRHRHKKQRGWRTCFHGHIHFSGARGCDVVSHCGWCAATAISVNPGQGKTRKKRTTRKNRQQQCSNQINTPVDDGTGTIEFTQQHTVKYEARGAVCRSCNGQCTHTMPCEWFYCLVVSTNQPTAKAAIYIIYMVLVLY